MSSDKESSDISTDGENSYADLNVEDIPVTSESKVKDDECDVIMIDSEDDTVTTPSTIKNHGNPEPLLSTGIQPQTIEIDDDHSTELVGSNSPEVVNIEEMPSTSACPIEKESEKTDSPEIVESSSSLTDDIDVMEVSSHKSKSSSSFPKMRCSKPKRKRFTFNRMRSSIVRNRNVHIDLDNNDVIDII